MIASAPTAISRLHQSLFDSSSDKVHDDMMPQYTCRAPERHSCYGMKTFLFTGGDSTSNG